MKISKKAIEKMSTPEGRMALMNALGVSEYWTRRLLSANKRNGPLTTAAALLAIEHVTKLKQKDILITEENEVA